VREVVMFKNMKIGIRLGICFGFIIILLVAGSVYSIRELKKLDENVALMASDRFPKTIQVHEISNNINIIARAIRNVLLVEDLAQMKEEAERVNTSKKAITEILEKLEGTITTEKGKELIKGLKDARETYLPFQTEVLELAVAGKKDTAVKILLGDLRTAQSAYIKSVENLGEYQKSLVEEAANEADKEYSTAFWFNAILALVSILLTGILGYLVTRSITNPITKCQEIAEQIANGDTDVSISVNSTDETGRLLSAMNLMASNIKSLVDDAKMLAKAAIEGKLATRADATKHKGDYNAIVDGVNKTLDAVIGPLNVAAEYIDRISKGDIPQKISDDYSGDFNEIKNNLNQLIDTVHMRNDDITLLVNAAVEGRLATRADTHKYIGENGKLVAGINKILDAVIGPLNVAAEYVDRIAKGDIPQKITDNYNGDFNEIKNNINTLIDALSGVIHEMNHMSKEHDAGDIDVVIPAEKFAGAYRVMGEGVNKMVMGHIAVKKKAMACIAEFGKGNFEADLEKFPGKKVFINNTIEEVRAKLKALIADAELLSRAAVEGKLATRADAKKHEGDFRKIVQGVNDTLDAVIGPLNVAAEYVDRIAKGDIPQKITENYNGDFNEIKNNLNTLVDALSGLIQDMNHMSKEHDAGDIDVVIPVEKFEGAYRVMGEGVNKMVMGHIAVKKKAMACIAEFGKGNFEADLEKFPGKKVFINNTIEEVRAKLKALIADADMLAKAAVEGKLATRADAKKHEGDFRKIVQGVNDTLDAVIGPLNVAAEYVDRIAKGDIPQKITENYNGDFNEIKNNLNSCVDAVNLLVKDAGTLVNAAVEGKLATPSRCYKASG
jgi:methyl-accepting chemotaxis protein